MGFKWNDLHTSELGVLAEVRTMPIFPEPIIITEEIAGRDGFYDFSTVNPDNRVHYKPREWEYRCSFERGVKDNIAARVYAITRLFSSYSGYLVDDSIKNVRWRGIVTNKFNLTNVARTLHTFGINFRTQPFAEGLETVNESFYIGGGGNITINNPGTWHVVPEVIISGEANDMYIGSVPVPHRGVVNGQPVYGLELPTGVNNIIITGFSGAITFKFVPLYIWG